MVKEASLIRSYSEITSLDIFPKRISYKSKKGKVAVKHSYRQCEIECCDVIVVKASFLPSTRKHESGVYKTFQLAKRFVKVAFSFRTQLGS